MREFREFCVDFQKKAEEKVAEEKTAEKGEMAHILFGPGVGAAVAAPKGRKMEAFKEGIGEAQGEAIKGMGIGAGAGGAAGAGVGAGLAAGDTARAVKHNLKVPKGALKRMLSGKEKVKIPGLKNLGRKAGLGALAGLAGGGFLGSLAGSLKGTYGKKSHDIVDKYRKMDEE